MWTVTWEGENPSQGSGRTSDLEISERVLVPTHAQGDKIAASRTESVLTTYVGQCKSAGEMVAGFVL